MSKKYVLDIKLNTNDIWLFSMYHSNRGFLGIFNIIFTIASIYSLAVKWNEINIGMRFIFILCASLFSVVQPVILYLKAAKQAKSQGIRDGFIIELDEKTLKVSQKQQSAVFNWEDIFKTMIRKKMIIIYLDNIRAYLIPNRYLENNEKEILTLLNSKTRVVRF